MIRATSITSRKAYAFCVMFQIAGVFQPISMCLN